MNMCVLIHNSPNQHFPAESHQCSWCVDESGRERTSSGENKRERERRREGGGEGERKGERRVREGEEQCEVVWKSMKERMIGIGVLLRADGGGWVEGEGERLCAYLPALKTRAKLTQTSVHRRAATTTTAKMGAVVGTLTMQTKQRRPSRGEGTHGHKHTRTQAIIDAQISGDTNNNRHMFPLILTATHEHKQRLFGRLFVVYPLWLRVTVFVYVCVSVCVCVQSSHS